MLTKARLLKHIEKFPEEFSVDELIDRLLFAEKLERRIQESKEDKTLSEEDLNNEIETWFK
jgi:hypothetical protein